MSVAKNIFDSLRPGRSKEVSLPEESALDIALQRLADATRANAEVCDKVRRRQSSGALKLVSVPPPPENHSQG